MLKLLSNARSDKKKKEKGRRLKIGNLPPRPPSMSYAKPKSHAQFKQDAEVKQLNELEEEERFLFLSTLKTRNTHTKKKYQLERRPSELNQYDARGYGPLKIAPIDQEETIKVPLYALAWGWNSDGRSGNVYSTEIHSPQQVQNSIRRNYIASAAGLHHSLLVDDLGIVYSFGSGRFGQLGYDNIFTSKKAKGGIVQSFPRQVTPTGELKFGRDLKMTQVQCGSHFSLAREATTEEGVDLFKNLRKMEEALTRLRNIYGESDAIQRAWAVVRQERFRASQIAQGLVCSWGTGERGQLGLGDYRKFVPAPTVIPRLRNVCIVHIAAGLNHVLAVSNTGYLFTWGSGKNGKLGHQDFDDRSTPCIVRFLEQLFVESCAAGDNHSAVLTTDRRGGIPREQQLRKVSCFGRGAHGRLGNGTNRNMPEPVLVEKWPISVRTCQIKQVVCGGAHTMVLVYKEVPKCLANPWGIQTFVCAWGYGGNGQLGYGYTDDQFQPVKAILPRCEVIAEIAAGRSWSMARTLGGTTYSWGKGVRGQLGQGFGKKFSIVPRKMDCFASLVYLGAGTYHNVCVGVPRRHLNEKISIQASKQDNVFADLVPKKLKPLHSDVVYSFLCCKRHINKDRRQAKMRFICKTCNITVMCHVCAQLCHIGHNVVESALRPGEIDEDAKIEKINEDQLQEKEWDLEEAAYDQELAMDILLEKVRSARAAAERAKSNTKAGRLAALKAMESAAAAAKASDAGDKKKNKKKQSGKQTAKSKVKVKDRKEEERRKKLLRLKNRKKKRQGEQKKKKKRKVPKLLALQIHQAVRGGDTYRLRSGFVLKGKPKSLDDTRREYELTIRAPGERRSKVQRMEGTKKGLDSSSRFDAEGSEYEDDDEDEDDDDDESKNMPLLYCRCSMHNPHCKLSAVIPEASNEDDEDINYHMDKRNIAASVIQRKCRQYIGYCRRKEIKASLAEVRHEIATRHFHSKILKPIMMKLERTNALYRESRELLEMVIEDDNKHKYDYKYNLQIALGGMDAMTHAVKTLYGRMSSYMPRIDNGIASDALRPTFAFSWSFVRNLQLQNHHLRTNSPATIARATKYMPLYDKNEGKFYDADVSLFTERFLRSKAMDRWREWKKAREERLAAEKARRAAIALAILQASAQAKKALFAAAAAVAGTAPPPPPSIPPSREILLANALERKREAKRREAEAIQESYKKEDAPFDLYADNPRPTVRRRNSIADPTNMCARISSMREPLQVISYAKRRNSLPTVLSFLHPKQRSPLPYVQEIVNSLSMFHMRLIAVKECFEPKYSVLWENVKPKKRKERKIKVLNFALFNPKFPREMQQLLTDNERRRTVGEPERLAKHFQVLFDTRNDTTKLREHFKTQEKAVKRRRSFDFAEGVDNENGINEALGYDVGPGPKLTLNSLRKDSAIMELRMSVSGIKKIEDENEGGGADSSSSGVNKKDPGGKSARRKNRGKTTAGILLDLPKDDPPPTENDGSGTQGQSNNNKNNNVKNTTSASVKPKSLNKIPAKKVQLQTNPQKASGSSNNNKNASKTTGSGTGAGKSSAGGYADPASSSSYVAGDGVYDEYANSAEYDYNYDESYTSNEQQQYAVLWQEHFSEEGYTYYYQPDTGESTWDYPAGDNVQILNQYQDTSGAWYWYNSVTGESTWA